MQKSYDAAFSDLNRGELGRALAAAEQQLQRIPPEQHYWHWKFLTLKAEALLQQRRTQDAIAALNVDFPSDLTGTDVDIRRQMTLAMANAYSLNPDAAQIFLTNAEKLARERHPELLGEVNLRQGTLAFTQGNNATAVGKYRQALELATQGKNPFLEAASLGSLGLMAVRGERYDESLEWNRQALQRSKELGATSYIARVLGNLGWAYLELGDYDQAMDLFGQALKAGEQAGIVRLQIDVLLHMAFVQHQQGKPDQAEESLQRALVLATSVSDKAAMAACFESLGQVAILNGKADSAKKYQERVLDFLRQYPSNSLRLNSDLLEGILRRNAKTFRDSESRFEEILRDSAATTALKLSAMDELAETYRAENHSADADREFRQALIAIDRARSELQSEELRLSFLSDPIEIYDHYIEFLVENLRVQDALRIAEQSRARTLQDSFDSGENRGNQLSTQVEPESVARKGHSRFLFYWLGGRRSYLWVITPQTVKLVELPNTREIEPVVKRYRQALLDGQDVLAAENPDGKRLYEILVAPAQRLIPRGSRVVVLPAESLYGLNFETLIVPGPQPHFWIEDATISTASSLGLLAAASTRQANATSKSLLLVGDAVPANADFPKLAQAPAEMQKVAGHFPREQETLLDGSGATPSAYLKSDPGKFSYLHFVTHGTASHTRPLESAVILSKEGDSYKLYARDIVQHPLSADLVTISACNGAGTRAYAGEGLVGLSWAFLRAGAHNVIGALWEVSDASSTPRLMDALYTGLDRGEDPAVALREAKLEILHASDSGVFRKPFYWAPFQLYAGMGATTEQARPVKTGAPAR